MYVGQTSRSSQSTTVSPSNLGLRRYSLLMNIFVAVLLLLCCC